MKNNLKIVIAVVITVVIFTGIGIYAETKISSDKVTYNDETVESALNKLYNRSVDKIVYKDLTIELNTADNGLKYTYDGEQIYPIYWYGYWADNNVYNTGYLNSWYETNGTVEFTYNKDYIRTTFTANKTTYCFGGATSLFLLDLTRYSSYNIIVKNSTVATKMQYVSDVGNLGNKISLNEKNYLTDIPATSTPTTYSSDISSINT